VFLSRITRRPSLRFAVRNACGRVMRRVRGIERPPVRQITDADLCETYLLLGFTVGVCAVGIPTICIVVIYLPRFACL
jgi:hypothetical protein